MRIYKNILNALPLIVAAGMIITGCSRTEADEREPERTPVRFVLSAGDMTRVATNSEFKSQFEDGDEVGIFAAHYTSGTGSLTPSGNILHNRKLTYDGTDWTLDGEPFYIPVDGAVDFYAYYPYDQDATDPTDMTFGVETDQSAQADFSRSDLMTAAATGVTAQDNTVTLNFTHRLAILELKFESGQAQLNKKVILEDYALATIGFSLQTLATNGSVTAGTATQKDITMYRPADGKAWALLPPGTITELPFLLDGDTYYITDALTLQAGEVKSYNVKLN